jgi:hypothetical protein
VAVAWLTRSRVHDRTDALLDLRSPDQLDDPARALGSRQGRRAASPAAGGRSVAEAEPETETGLGRPGDHRRPGPAAPQAAADEPARDAGNAAALAPAAGPLAVDLSPPRRQAACRSADRGADRTDGAGEPGLGLPADPGRTARSRYPRRGVHGAPGAEAAADTSGAAAQPADLAAVPAYAGIDHARVRLLPCGLRDHLAPRLRVLRDRRWAPAACMSSA